MKHYFTLLLISILFVNCKKDPVSNNEDPLPTFSESFTGIEPLMIPYFKEFEEEANKRGLSFIHELNELDTHFENIPNSGVAGQCQWASNSPNLVTIDSPFWNNANISEREWVMFHELGHCVLDRGHTEAQNGNGVCLSIMASGTGDCTTLYNDNNREYYLNELFQNQIKQNEILVQN